MNVISIDDYVAELRKNLESLRGCALSPVDASTVQSAWKWARRDNVPNTPGNKQSLTFYILETGRMLRPVRDIGRVS